MALRGAKGLLFHRFEGHMTSALTGQYYRQNVRLYDNEN
jgi:hypothetical protein